MGEGRREVTLELDLFFLKTLSLPLAQSWRRCWAAPLQHMLIQPSLEHPVGCTLCCFHRSECKRHCSPHKIPDSLSALSLLQGFPTPPPAASPLTPHLRVVPHPRVHVCFPPTAHSLPWGQGEEDAPPPSTTLPILLTHHFHIWQLPLPQTPPDIGSEMPFSLIFLCHPSLFPCSHPCSLTLPLSIFHFCPRRTQPRPTPGKTGHCCESPGQAKAPSLSVVSLCHKQEVPGLYCRAAALAGKVTCGLSPWHAF